MRCGSAWQVAGMEHAPAAPPLRLCVPSVEGGKGGERLKGADRRPAWLPRRVSCPCLTRTAKPPPEGWTRWPTTAGGYCCSAGARRSAGAVQAQCRRPAPTSPAAMLLWDPASQGSPQPLAPHAAPTEQQCPARACCNGCRQYVEQGAKFAKWRAALKLDGSSCPSERAVQLNAEQLADYAVICQVSTPCAAAQLLSACTSCHLPGQQPLNSQLPVLSASGGSSRTSRHLPGRQPRRWPVLNLGQAPAPIAGGLAGGVQACQQHSHLGQVTALGLTRTPAAHTHPVAAIAAPMWQHSPAAGGGSGAHRGT